MIVLDTETINKIENTEEDICFQLSILDTDRNINITDNCKPKDYENMSIEAQEVTNITPDMIKDYPKIQDTKCWKYLNFISKEENIIIGHNIPFDIEVIKRTGIDTSKFKLIDTLQIARFLNDNLGLPWESCRLSYLKYQHKLYNNREEIEKRYNITKKVQAHDSLNDVLDCLLLWEYFRDTYNIKIEDAIKISTNPILLTYMNNGKYKGTKIEDLDYGTLKWNYENSWDANVRFSCKKYL